VRIWIGIRLSITTTNKNTKNALKTYLFLMRMHDCTHASIHINSLHCLSMMRKRMVKKERSLIETWFFFMHKTTKEKLWNSTIKLTVEPQKGPKTAEQSTQNVALYEINARWERKKAKNNSILASSDGMYIPVHHGEFFCQLMALLLWTVFRLHMVLVVLAWCSLGALGPRTYSCLYWTLWVLWSTLSVVHIYAAPSF